MLYQKYSVEGQVPRNDSVDFSYFNDVLFIGDSLTYALLSDEKFSNLQIIASVGMSAENVSDKKMIRQSDGTLLTAAEASKQYEPAKIYILIGANSVPLTTKETFIDNYSRFVDELIKLHPKSDIYIQSVFPVTREKSLSENGIYSNKK